MKGLQEAKYISDTFSCNVWNSSQYSHIESNKDKKIPKVTKKLDLCDI